MDMDAASSLPALPKAFQSVRTSLHHPISEHARKNWAFCNTIESPGLKAFRQARRKLPWVDFKDALNLANTVFLAIWLSVRNFDSAWDFCRALSFRSCRFFSRSNHLRSF